MLGKLIKYDFKSLSRVLIPALLAIIVAAPMAGGLLNLTGVRDAMDIPSILKVISGFMTAMLIFCIFAACFVILFIILQRFYKSTVTSEGYLTFTLPVTSGRILWSKLIVAMLWSLITSVALFISFNLFILVAPMATSGTNAFVEMWKAVGDMLNHYLTGATALLGIEMIIIALVALAGNFLEFFLAIIIGGVVSKKHKVLAGIGFFFIINTVEGIVSSIVMQSMIFSSFMSGSSAEMHMEMQIEKQIGGGLITMPHADVLAQGVAQAQPFLLATLGITAVFAVACFILCNYLMKNKLNLA